MGGLGHSDERVRDGGRKRDGRPRAQRAGVQSWDTSPTQGPVGTSLRKPERFRNGLRRAAWAALALVALAAAGEVLLRAAGILNFPLYRLDPEAGYRYAPGQSGSFLNRNRWTINELSMPTTRRWQPGTAPDLLVVGNSIVAGGNPYDQREKLGAAMERALADRFAVWPVATGGWSVVNQMGYLRTFPEVTAAADLFVWSYTSGGLWSASPWLGDDVFPRERPRSALAYVVRKQLLQRFGRGFVAQGEGRTPGTTARSPQEVYAGHLAQFDATLGALAAATGRRTPGVLLLYPTAAQLAHARGGAEWLAERADLVRVANGHGVVVIDLAATHWWEHSHYRDGVHPTVEGNQVLARILVEALDRALEE